MNRMGQLALFGLLVGTSSNLFAAPGSISGVIRFTGAIVEPPCSMSAPRQDESKGSFHLSGCPMQARTADVSIRSMKTGEVRHLQPAIRSSVNGISRRAMSWPEAVAAPATT